MRGGADMSGSSQRAVAVAYDPTRHERWQGHFPHGVEAGTHWRASAAATKLRRWTTQRTHEPDTSTRRADRDRVVRRKDSVRGGLRGRRKNRVLLCRRYAA